MDRVSQNIGPLLVRNIFHEAV